MWILLAGGLALIAIGGMAIWFVKHTEGSGAARANLKTRDDDLKFREKFDEAGQEWDAGGGLGGRSRRVRQSRRND